MSSVKMKFNRRGKRLMQIAKQRRKNLLVGVLPEDQDKTHPTNGTATVGQVAVWMEYGTEDIPARSWLRDWYSGQEKRIIKDIATATYRVLLSEETETAALTKLGIKYERQIKSRIHAGLEPELDARTVLAKGHDTPLIDTETLLDNIRWKVE